MNLTIKIGGAAGQGVFVLGRTIGRLFARSGFYTFGYPEYPSLIRGGHNTYQVIISNKKIETPLSFNSIVIALNKEAVRFHAPYISKNGILIVDKSISEVNVREDIKVIKIPTSKIISESKGNPRMVNIALTGAMLPLFNLSLNTLNQIIEDEFSRKGEDIVKVNQLIAKNAYNYVKENYGELNIKFENSNANLKAYISGNEAFALGAIKGGLKFYAAYPMTPATSVLHYLISKAKKHDLVVVQAEDEIAAANMAVGASFAGLRSMVGTSGGGFALMTETVGMAALAETPIVFFIAQRVGPSTGMPTWTEQGDLWQVLGASQGEFLRVILSPGNAEEAFYMAGEALNIAEEYQLPVFVLSDKFLSESHYSMENINYPEVRRGKIIKEGLKPLKKGERFKRYMNTDDGISPRTFPGIPNGEHVATSYEHLEDSFTTENFEKRTEQVEKRLRKLKKLKEIAFEPKVYGKGDISLVVGGSQLGPALESKEMLSNKGINVKVIHFTWLYPLNKEKIERVLSKTNIIIENNRTGLFEKLIKAETGIVFTASIRKSNGRPLFPEQIAKAVEMIINGEFKEKEFIIKNEEFEPYEFYAPWRYE